MKFWMFAVPLFVASGALAQSPEKTLALAPGVAADGNSYSVTQVTGGAEACATNAAPQVEFLLSIGARRISLPAHCTYIPKGDVTPAGVQIDGQDWTSSIISVADRSKSTVRLGAGSRLTNVAIADRFCDQLTDPVSTPKLCPVGIALNEAGTPQTLSNWAFQSLYVAIGPESMGPNGIKSTDVPGVAINSASPSGDNLFLGVGPNTRNGVGSASGIRIVTNASPQSDGANGIFLLNGFNGGGSARNKGVVVKDFTNGSDPLTVAMEIDRIGDATGVSRSLLIHDLAAKGLFTAPAIAISLNQQSGGSLVKIDQGTTPFGGDVEHTNMGNRQGTFTGNFFNHTVAGASKARLDYQGNLTIAGALTMQNIKGGMATDYACLTAGGQLIRQKQPCGIGPLRGNTDDIGGKPLAAGHCASGTARVDGATDSMVVETSPKRYPGDGFTWAGYVRAPGEIAVKVCAIVAGTPAASSYNLSIFP